MDAFCIWERCESLEVRRWAVVDKMIPCPPHLWNPNINTMWQKGLCKCNYGLSILRQEDYPGFSEWVQSNMKAENFLQLESERWAEQVRFET